MTEITDRRKGLPAEEFDLDMTLIHRGLNGLLVLLAHDDHQHARGRGRSFGSAYGKRNGTRKISAAGRARIAAAQRARWAKAKVTPKKRVMSATARKRIAEAQKKRWSAWKAKKAAKS